MKLVAAWSIPMKVVSEQNTHEYWWASMGRHKMQKLLVKNSWNAQKGLKFDLPAHIVLTRLSPRFLDSDNLPSSLKWIRDALADCIIPGLRPGRADDQKKGLTFEVKQEKAKEQGVKIQIYEISN